MQRMSSHALPHPPRLWRPAPPPAVPTAASSPSPGPASAPSPLFRNWPPRRGAGRHPGLLLAVAAAHVLLVLALLALRVAPPTPDQATPLQVSLISPAARPLADAPALPVPARHLPSPPPPSVPVVLVQAPSPLPTAAPVPQPALPVPQALPAPAAPAAPAATPPALLPANPAPSLSTAVAPPKPAPTPVPAEPRSVPASALRYLVPPAVEVPVASRRMGEQGTVVLRVVFDVGGRPRLVQVQRSSGHARLDQQAVAAMQAARIAPYLDNGQAVEVSALAPLAYELD